MHQNSLKKQWTDNQEKNMQGPGLLDPKTRDEELEEDIGNLENIEGDWINMCFVNSKPVDQKDICFQTLENSKLAENHIIICGWVENIKYFVMPLRAKHLKNPSPIVIIHHEVPNEKQWN